MCAPFARRKGWPSQGTGAATGLGQKRKRKRGREDPSSDVPSFAYGAESELPRPPSLRVFLPHVKSRPTSAGINLAEDANTPQTQVVAPQSSSGTPDALDDPKSVDGSALLFQQDHSNKQCFTVIQNTEAGDQNNSGDDRVDELHGETEAGDSPTSVPWIVSPSSAEKDREMKVWQKFKADCMIERRPIRAAIAAAMQGAVTTDDEEGEDLINLVGKSNGGRSGEAQTKARELPKAKLTPCMYCGNEFAYRGKKWRRHYFACPEAEEICRTRVITRFHTKYLGLILRNAKSTDNPTRRGIYLHKLDPSCSESRRWGYVLKPGYQLFSVNGQKMSHITKLALACQFIQNAPRPLTLVWQTPQEWIRVKKKPRVQDQQKKALPTTVATLFRSTPFGIVFRLAQHGDPTTRGLYLADLDPAGTAKRKFDGILKPGFRLVSANRRDMTGAVDLRAAASVFKGHASLPLMLVWESPPCEKSESSTTSASCDGAGADL